MEEKKQRKREHRREIAARNKELKRLKRLKKIRRMRKNFCVGLGN